MQGTEFTELASQLTSFGQALADVYSATNDHARRELLAESLATQLEQAKKIKGFQNWTYQTAQSAICAGNHANVRHFSCKSAISGAYDWIERRYEHSIGY